MTTDRELMELAAKAVGYAYNRMWFDQESGLLVWEPPTNYESRNWNPLTDDGDALRLAVKLMNFNLSGKHAAVAQSGCAVVQQYCNGDPYAATRRAIVRAAAEIGRGIPRQPAMECVPEDNYYKTQAEAEERSRAAAAAAAELGRERS